MKRKIAILLSAVMVASAMPLSAMAASTNEIDDTVSIKYEEILETAGKLTIKPTSNYNGGTFYIDLTNATYVESEIKKLSEQTWADVDGEKSFDEILSTYGDLETYAKALFDANGGDKINVRIPYKITYRSSTSVEVKMLPIENDFADWAADSDGYFRAQPYAEISLAGIIKSGTSGTMTATIDGNSTGISSGTYTIGTVISSSGSTTTTVADIITFNEEGTLEAITIKENASKSFVDGGTNFAAGSVITLRLNSGFEFATSQPNLVVKGSRNLDGEVKITSSNYTVDGNTLKITLDSAAVEQLVINTSLVSALDITGVTIVPKDEDKNYGTVRLTISGNSSMGITQETIEVATRQADGLTMELLEDATTIISGRTYAANSDLDEDDFVTAKVRVSEAYSGAWGDSRLDFTVPEGVQITEVEVTKLDNSSVGSSFTIDATETGESYTDDSSYFSITNDGTTFRVGRKFNSTISDGEEVKFDVVFKLSVVAGYEGDITLSASGAGYSEGDIKDLVIATAISPIVVEANSTNVNLGYTSYNTGDINIIETVPGALIEGQDIVIELDTSFGSEIAITSADVTTTSDELTLSNVDVSSSKITMTVKNASYDEAATIKISNVQVGTTRSIPYGSYDLKISGGAIINNYNEDNYATASSSYVSYAYNKDISHYTLEDYVNLVTSTGTLDNVVKVTIGESTVLINDEAVDMDVAPYIQASSNSTLVPLRFVTVALGLDGDSIESADETSKISFDSNTKTATIYYGSGTSAKVIQFQAGSNVMNIAGTSIAMENGVVAEIKDGRMFVPFRALGQALGVSVSWDEETRTAIYNAN